jgi:hypothetical protein
MSGQSLRRIVGLILLSLSLALLVWGLQPARLERHTLMIPPGELGTEGRLITLEWPALLRRQDSDFIRLTLAPEGGDPENSLSGSGRAQFMAFARLEIEGVEYTPPGEVTQALLSGRVVQFIWSVRPMQAGNFNGAVWLHSQPVGVEDNPVARQVIAAPKIEIQAQDVFGLGGPWARALGSAGAAIGAVFSMEGLLIGFWRWLSRKPLQPSPPHLD